MNNRYYKVPIQVKPYVKKYIHSMYGDNIFISLQDPLSIVLYAFLQKKNIHLLKDTAKFDSRYNELKANIIMMVPKRDQYKHGLFISPQNHIIINHFFEQELTKALYCYCTSFEKAGLKRKNAIEEFCREHAIEIDRDISIDAITKAVYRYSEERKNNKAAQQRLITERNIM